MNIFTKIRRKTDKTENRISVIFFAVTMLIAISPLLSRYCINGHDLDYHLLRIESLKEGILIGRPFMKVNTLFFGDAGYASSMFYSDLFMYLPALLRVCGVSIAKSYHIFVACVFALGYLITYYSVYKISLSKYAASIAAMILTLCPYHYDDILLRGACGEYLAFMFVPLVIYGVYNVVFEEMDNPMAFGIGFAGLILTHPATCILCAVFAFCAFVIYIKSFIKEPERLLKLAVVTIITLCISAYFWVPMLEQFRSATFYVSDNWTDLLDAALNFSDVFSETFPCLGFLLIAFMLPRFCLRRKEFPVLSYVDTMLLAAFLFILGSTNLVPWERFGRYFSFLQFPWRMLIMSSTLLAMADAVIIKLFIEKYGDTKRELMYSFALIVVLALFSQDAIDRFHDESLGYYDYADDYYSFVPYTQSVIAGEWLPTSVTNRDDLIYQCSMMLFEDGSSNDFVRNKATIECEVPSGHSYVDVPFIFYKGYKAYLTDQSGETVNPVVTNEGCNGMCRVMLNGLGGHLKVYYFGTTAQFVSYGISVLTVLILLAVWFFEYRNMRKLKANAQKAGAVISAMIIAVLSMTSVLLTGCSGNYVPARGQAGIQRDENLGSFSNPEDMVEYMKSKDAEKEKEEEAKREEEIKSLVTVNICSKGYDSKGKGFAVKIDESSGEQMISLLYGSEIARLEPEGYFEKENPFGSLIYDETKRMSEPDMDRESLVMSETDMLLCLEVYSDMLWGRDLEKNALKVADRILTDSESGSKSTIDKYNYSAVLAKASYVLEDWDNAGEAESVSEELFEEAEEDSREEGESIASRVFAAAELYRLTGLKTYRSVVDAALMDTVPEGFSYDEPGYYGLFTYLMSDNQGNYKVSSSMMNYIFAKANAIIKEDFEEEILSLRIDDSLKDNEKKVVKNCIEKARLLSVTDYISACVEYKEYIENALCFSCGANLSGTDYTLEGEELFNEPMFFVYGSLAGAGERLKLAP